MNDPVLKLQKQFKELVPPQGDDETCFSVANVTQGDGLYVGKNSLGQPAFLLLLKESEEAGLKETTRLENVVFHQRLRCRLVTRDKASLEADYAVIRFTSPDRSLEEYFIRVVGVVLLRIEGRPTRLRLISEFTKLIELFRNLEMPMTRTLQGLWAELFVLTNSRRCTDAASAWHEHERDVFDFAHGDERLEVKSTSKQIREHSFSLEQLLPREGTQVYIASLFVHRDAAGKSIVDLADDVRLALAGELEILDKFERILAASLGNNWQSAGDERFSVEIAENSLRFFEADKVPRLKETPPIGVSCVRYHALLERTQPISQPKKLGSRLLDIFVR